MYNFTITATDNGLIPRQSTPAGHVIIHVTDINDNPPIFQQPTYNFTVEEESNVGLIIGMVSASDHDSGQNQIIMYHIVLANPNGSFFTIDDQTGEISILSSLDREHYSQHELVVVAADQGLPALTGTTNVSITITTAFGKVATIRIQNNMHLHTYSNHIKSIICFTVPSLQETAQSVNVLVGQSVTLSCVPTPEDLMVNWTVHGDVIDNSDRVSLSPENLQHVLTIRNAATSDSGEYICYIVDFPLLINRTIRLNVLQGTYFRLNV